MEKFLLGASTAAYQVEGNNKDSDFWLMEQLEHTSFKELSGDAVDHYNRYPEDIALMKSAGMNAYRFSFEWARIEPEKGKYNTEEIEHYRKVLKCCHENGITPVVTMHHFSSPQWLIRENGWENEKVVEYFKNYCVYVAEHLGDEMEYVCTINEANMRLQISSVMRTMVKNMGINLQMGMNFELPEEYAVGQREVSAAFGGVKQANTFMTPCTPEGDALIMKAHEAARDAMKEKCPHLKVGVTLSLHDIQPVEGGEKYAKEAWNEEFRHYIPSLQKDDFIGVQNYTRTLTGIDGELPVPEGKRRTQMEYEFYPEALEHVIRRVSEELSKPILITENGIATLDDSERLEFLQTALTGVKKCIADGIPVIGYLHWSLLDNFEWQLGYSRNFGLIAVDRNTQERKPRESFFKMAEIWENSSAICFANHSRGGKCD